MTDQKAGIFAHAPRSLRAALCMGVLGLIVITLVMAGLWTALAGAPGLWGALVGAGIGGAFMLITVISVLATARSSVGVMGAVVLGGWLLKLVVALGVFAALGKADFYNRPALAITVCVTLVVVLFSETLAVLRTRELYVDPDIHS